MKAEHGQVFTLHRSPRPTRLSGRFGCRPETLRAGPRGPVSEGTQRGTGQRTHRQSRWSSAVRLDGDLIPELGRTLAGLNVTIIHGDALELGTGEDFDIALMNPPFARILTNSHARKMMRTGASDPEPVRRLWRWGT